MGSGGFSARAQSAGDRNANAAAGMNPGSTKNTGNTDAADKK